MGKSYYLGILDEMTHSDNEVAAQDPGLNPQETEVVFEDRDIEITCLQGNPSRSVVAFAGIGMGLGGLQIEEFRKSLSGTSNSVYFVKEKSRHWFNSSFSTVKTVLNDRLASATDVRTIGNSMGGFAAIAFASQLRGCRAALAFSPQSTVDPAITPWEVRYDQFTKSVTTWNGMDAVKLLSRAVEYRVLVSTGDIADLMHADRFLAAGLPSVMFHIVEGSNHNLVYRLKVDGALQPIIDDIILGDLDAPGWGSSLETIAQYKPATPS